MVLSIQVGKDMAVVLKNITQQCLEKKVPILLKTISF